MRSRRAAAARAVRGGEGYGILRCQEGTKGSAYSTQGNERKPELPETHREAEAGKTEHGPQETMLLAPTAGSTLNAKDRSRGTRRGGLLWGQVHRSSQHAHGHTCKVRAEGQSGHTGTAGEVVPPQGMTTAVPCVTRWLQRGSAPAPTNCRCLRDCGHCVGQSASVGGPSCPGTPCGQSPSTGGPFLPRLSSCVECCSTRGPLGS